MTNTNGAETTALEITVVEEKINGMKAMVEAVQITDENSLADVAQKIKTVKEMGKLVRQEMERYTKPAQEVINNARSRYLPYEKECAEAERILKSKASVYMMELERERARKEEAIAKRFEKGQIKETTAIAKMEALGEERKTIQTNTGAKLTMKTVRTAVIVDPTKVPDEYWILDEVRIRRVALAGGMIPGVEIQETKQMSV